MKTMTFVRRPLVTALAVAASAVASLLLVRAASAQVRAIVTDQTALSLPSTVDLAWGRTAWNRYGDLVFTDQSGSAVFLKRAGGSLGRLLQAGQPVPGIAHTRLESFAQVSVNSLQVVCVEALYYQGASTSDVILVRSGSGMSALVTSFDTAPGTRGQPFGLMTLVGMNDAGDVALTATTVPIGTAYTGETLFVIPEGEKPVRIAGPGDAVPGTAATMTALASLSLNQAGEVLFRATLSTGGYAYLAGSAAGGVRKIVAHGDAAPGGGTIDFSTTVPHALANNEGEVAFRDASRTVYIHTAAAGLTAAFGPTTPVPAPLDTRTLTDVTLQAFTDRSEIVFTSWLTGSSTNNHGLFRFSSGRPLDLLAYKGQTVPGLTQAFGTISSARYDAFNNLAFASTLTPSAPAFSGLFVWPDGGHVEPVVLDGAATGLPGGGTYSSPGSISLLEHGFIAFQSEIAGGAATYGHFVSGESGVEPVATDADALPAGSLVTFRTLWPLGAGNYVGFTAARTGGARALFVHDAITGVTHRVVGIGDAAPGGGTITAAGVNGGAVYLDAAGRVVFGASVSGTAGYVFVWDATNGVRRLAGPGDVEPSSGHTITEATLCTLFLQSPMNEAGQVPIKATFATSTDYGIYVAAIGQPLRKVVRVNSASPYGDPAPSGGAFVSVSRWLLNDAGLVAFQAQTRVPDGTTPGLRYDGIFTVANSFATPATVWVDDQVAPAVPPRLLSALRPGGAVIFFAPGANRALSLYAGNAGSPPFVIAAAGAAAPAGGNYSFPAGSVDVEFNARGDLVFQASLVGGASDSGLFMRRAATGTIEALAIQGQAAPETAGTFGTFRRAPNYLPGESYAVDPAGDVMFAAYVVEGEVQRLALYRYRSGTVELVGVRGGPVPGGAGGTVASLGNGPGSGRAGLFFFRTSVIDGTTFGDAILATRAAPAITWPTPSAIVAGTALGVAQLNATADVAGTFTYTPPAGTVLLPGVGQTLSVTFTPADATIYEPVTTTVTIDVVVGVPTVTGMSPSHGPAAGGMSMTITGHGFVPGATVTFGGTTSPWVVVVDTTTMTVLTPAHGPGLVDVVVTNPGVTPVVMTGGFRYLPPPAGHDFDGDHLIDLAVYRPSSGTWFSLDSSAGNSTYRFRGWGSQAHGDVPVAGDFDGDGVVDPTVFRPATGTWFILESHAGFTTWAHFGWGEATDTLVAGDYDGDGKTDGAVYRASTGTWYVRPSSGAAPWSVVFGGAGDEPIAGDFDGDGIRDVAVYRAASGTWFWLKSSANFTAMDYRGWGVQVEGDRPAPGDYDGDGKTDLCVFRPASGTWFILETHANYSTWGYFGWGQATDTLMPADYDGDRKTDAAIYRPSTGEWFVRPTSGAVQWSVTFGGPGDVPLGGVR